MSYESVIAKASHVGHWPMQDDAASTAVVNELGADAALDSGTTGGLSTTGPGFGYDKALAFTDGGPALFLDSAFGTAGPFTVSLWARFDAADGPDFFFSVFTDPNARWGRNSGSTGGIVRFAAGSTFSFYDFPAVVAGEWNLHTIRRNASGVVTIFFDGAVQDTVSGFSPTEPLGWVRVNNGRPFDGAMAGLRHFEEALTDAEVADLAAGPTATPDPTGTLLMKRRRAAAAA